MPGHAGSLLGRGLRILSHPILTLASAHNMSPWMAQHGIYCGFVRLGSNVKYRGFDTLEWLHDVCFRQYSLGISTVS